jgi:hypothetical protein
MPSSSDYILAKKIFAIKQNYDMVAQSDDCCYGPTFIGDCPPSIPGPPGPSGDRYLTSFTKKIHQYVLDTGAIGLQLEPNLAYVHGQSIYCVHDTATAPFDYFKGTVKTYHPTTGLMHVENIHSVSCNFEYSTERTYKINIDYSTCVDESDDIAHNHSITLDNETDDRNYITFSAKTQGPLYPKTSHDLSFVPNTGELYTNVIYESKQANATSAKYLAQDDALNFVKKLKPIKFSQQSETHYGFLATKDFAEENPGIAKNNSICYSDFSAPIISVLQTLVDKMSQIEIRMTQMEKRMNQLVEYQKNDHHSHGVISVSGIHRRAFCIEDGKHRPAYHDIKPAEPDCKPHVPECKPAVPECKPLVPECNTTVYASRPHILDCIPHVPECNTTVYASRPHILDCIPHVPECNTTVYASRPHILDCKPPVPECKPPVPECKPPVPESRPHISDYKPPTKPSVPEYKPPTKPPVYESRPHISDCIPPTKPPVTDCIPPTKPPVYESRPHISDCKPTPPPKPIECIPPPRVTCPNPNNYSKEELYALASLVDYIVPGEEKVSVCEIKQVDDLGDVIHLIAEATRKYNREHPTNP